MRKKLSIFFNENQLKKKDLCEDEQNKKTTETIASVSDITVAEISQNQNNSKDWCDDEVRLLVKGVKIIPVGTRDRWDVIANFIEEHSKGKFKRTGKEVLNKTKDLQKMGKTHLRDIFYNHFLNYIL